LDAFAGSGALGFEALSRGARHVVFVEKSKDVACQLIDNGHWLKAEKVQVFNADTQAWLAQAVNEPFDIVFMDPPFNQGLVEPTLAKLLENDWLSNQAWLVVEQEKSLAWSSLLTEFELYREKTTAQTRIGLWRRQAKEE
jgi:16S rRNA (guanine966-N2)-methyltransferase